MDFNSIISIIGLFIGLISILLGIFVLIRCEGKLRVMVVFLIFAIFLLIFDVAIQISGFSILEDSVTSDIRSFSRLFVLIFIFCALFIMQRMISDIDKSH